MFDLDKDGYEMTREDNLRLMISYLEDSIQEAYRQKDKHFVDLLGKSKGRGIKTLEEVKRRYPTIKVGSLWDPNAPEKERLITIPLLQSMLGECLQSLLQLSYLLDDVQQSQNAIMISEELKMYSAPMSSRVVEAMRLLGERGEKT